MFVVVPQWALLTSSGRQIWILDSTLSTQGGCATSQIYEDSWSTIVNYFGLCFCRVRSSSNSEIATVCNRVHTHKPTSKYKQKKPPWIFINKSLPTCLQARLPPASWARFSHLYSTQRPSVVKLKTGDYWRHLAPRFPPFEANRQWKSTLLGYTDRSNGNPEARRPVPIANMT